MNPEFRELILANDGAELKRLLREVGLPYQSQYDPNEIEDKHFWALVGTQKKWQGADTEAAALFAAAEAALGLGGGE